MNSSFNEFLLRLHPELRCSRSGDEQHQRLLEITMRLQQELRRSTTVLSPTTGQALVDHTQKGDASIAPPSLGIGLRTARGCLPPLIR